MKQKGVGELFQNLSAQLKARPKAVPAKIQARPARGKPKLSVVRAASPPAPPSSAPIPVVDEAPGKARVKVSPEAMLRARARPAAKQRINPFVLANHPPSVFPKGASTLAMDSAIADSLAWASSALITSTSAFGYQPIYEAGLGFLGYTYLAELSQRAEYRVISETLATESTRKWIKLQATTEDGEDRTDRLKALKDELERLNVQEVCRTSSLKDGFFGRTHVFIDTGQDDPQELKTPIGDGRSEFSQKKFAKGFLKAFRCVEPVWCYPSNYNASNPLAADFYNPAHWYCQGQELAASRLLTFVGREVPDLLKPAYSFGGLSMSQMVKPTVDNWLRTRQSVSDITHAFSVMVLETELAQTLAAGGEEFFNRIDFFNATRDNRGLMAVNKGTESLSNVSAPLGTLDKLQAQAQEHMSSISRIPIVKLLGIQPAGLNASSEGEMQTWDDWVAAYQEMFFGENLRRMIGFAQINLWGKVDPSISFAFEPLRQMTEKERGEIRKNNADTDVAYVNAGVLNPEEVRAAIASDEESPYATIDVDDVPEPPQQGGEGGDDPDGGGEPVEETVQPEVGEDAVVPFVVARDAWTESDHPRGQPGNAGQFGSGGGSSKQKIQAPQYGMPHGKFTALGGGAHSPTSASSATKRTNVGEPLDVSKLKKVGAQMGSNPGGVYEGDGGKKFYVKKGQTKDHVRNEMTAAALYGLAGSPTLRYRPVEGGTHVATEMAKLDKDNASKLSPEERAEAQREFAVHAWLGNYDAVGLGGDNLGTVDGTPTALDLGGALEYRAQGKPKGEMFGTSVGEVDSLRDPKINKDAAGMFGDMTPAQLRESARYVTSIPDAKVRDTILKAGGTEALAVKMIARKRDLAEQAKTFGAEGDPKKPTSTMVVPDGGVMPVEELNGVKFDAWAPPEDWASVDGQARIEEPEFVVSKGKKPSTGVIITEKDGRVWIVQPRGGYGDYEGTFPKGGVEEGLSLQANAIKEAYEESGLKVRIVGHAGDADGDMTTTRYYHAVREGGDPSKHDNETEGVVLAPKDKVAGFLNRERDRKIVGADALFENPDLDTQYWVDQTTRTALGAVNVNVTIEERRNGRLPIGSQFEDEPDEEAEGTGDDEAPFEESKHPRDDDGKFATSAGGGAESEGSSAKPGESILPGNKKKGAFGGLFKTSGKTPQENYGLTVADYLTKPAKSGSHYRNMLAHLIKEAKTHGYESSVPKLKEKLGQAFFNAGEKAMQMASKSTGAEADKFEAMGKKAFAQAKAHGHTGEHGAIEKVPIGEKPAPKPDVTKAIAEQAMKDNPGMAAALKQKATPDEMKKASKSVALQAQYVPGFGDLQFMPTKAQANDLVGAFNEKWADKDGLDNAQLETKVHDFKMLTAKVATLKAAEAVNAQQLKAKEQAEQQAAAAKQAEKNKKAADALKEQQQAAKAKNQEYMKALGISETEASGFDALVDMMSESSSKADLIEKFKSYQSAAEKLGYPISGFQYALIRNYIDGGYKSINKALRSNSPSVAQHVYARLVNNAIDKLPKYTGTVVRGTTLNAQDLAVYKPGHVVQEHGFTSTGVGYKFGGNVHYTIKAHGMRGGDFSTGANTGEKEVLFKAKTQFLVHKVEKKGETTYIEMEEVEGHG